MAATPSFLVKPKTTPMAKIRGKIIKMASPEADMIRPISASQGASASRAMEAPTPNRMPATGNTDTGSIRALPIFCRPPKVSPQTVDRLIVFSGSNQ